MKILIENKHAAQIPVKFNLTLFVTNLPSIVTGCKNVRISEACDFSSFQREARQIKVCRLVACRIPSQPGVVCPLT